MAAVTQEQIIAALKNIGPVSPGRLAAELAVESSALGYHLRMMLTDGTLKATGTTKGRRIALPEQKFDEASAPPQGDKAAPKARKTRKAKKQRKAKKARAPRTPPAARPAERFIPVVDAEKRLHIINGGAPVSFDGPQTLAIAELLFNHYEE